MNDQARYEFVEKAARDWARQTRDRSDIDRATKDQIVLNQAAKLDSLRAEKGIRE